MKTEESWKDIEQVMHAIGNNVRQIDSVIREQISQLDGVSDNFQQMDHSFEATSESIKLNSVISQDITMLGDKLHDLTKTFTVSQTEFQTDRREEIRKERGKGDSFCKGTSSNDGKKNAGPGMGWHFL